MNVTVTSTSLSPFRRRPFSNHGFESMWNDQGGNSYYSGYVRARVMYDEDVPANVKPCGQVGFQVER